MFMKTHFNRDKNKITSKMIKDVYEDNFIEEIEQLSSSLENYNYISMVL
jgi:hypothetical protein